MDRTESILCYECLYHNIGIQEAWQNEIYVTRINHQFPCSVKELCHIQRLRGYDYFWVNHFKRSKIRK